MTETHNGGGHSMYTCQHESLIPNGDMAVCERGKLYMQSLVDGGELPVTGCEECTIEWLCGEPNETCMNPEDTTQWWEQCVRPRQWWVGVLTSLWNSQSWWKSVTHHPWYASMVQSWLGVMEKHSIKFKLE